VIGAVRRWQLGACLLGLGCALAFLLAGPARAERAAAGNLVVSLTGSLAPRTLPRTHPAPISLGLSSDFSTSDGTALPELRSISISIGSRGRMTDRGLPSCPSGRIFATTLGQARKACGSARVGRGRIVGELAFPGAEPVPFEAVLVAFNARLHGGGRAILVDAHSSAPPMSFVLKFVLHHNGRSGSPTLVARLPRTIRRWARLSHFELTLHRTYRYRGGRLSYLNAACSVPRRLTGIVFPLATVTYGFATRKVSVTAVRACRARG
jgi:hypothetical protein